MPAVEELLEAGDYIAPPRRLPPEYSRTRYHQVRDLGRSAKTYAAKAAGQVLTSWAAGKLKRMGALRKSRQSADAEASADHEAPPDATPGQSRTMDVDEVVTDEHGRTSARSTTVRSDITESSMLTGKGIYGASALPSVGSGVLTRLRMKIGGREYPDQRESLLNLLIGANAYTRTKFAGRMLVPVGQRNYHHQVFRHNYATSSNFDVSALDAEFLKRVLVPNPHSYGGSVPSTSGFLAGKRPDGSAGSVPATLDTSFRDMEKGYVYFSDINRSDIEDLSWNQSNLKIVSAPTGYTNTNQTIYPDSKTGFGFQFNKRRFSEIYLHNKYDNQESVGTSNKPIRGKYKAVMNYGRVVYQFMNKGDAGAEVVVLVQKVKNNHVLSDEATTYAIQDVANPTPEQVTAQVKARKYPMQDYIDAVGLGLSNKMKQAISTEMVGGVDNGVNVKSVVDDPRFPFMPNLKQTKQTDCHISEVSRQTFAMPAGARRLVTIDLPGLVYDPVQNLGPIDAEDATPSATIMDKYTYIVTLACNGVKSTRFVNGTTINTPGAWQFGGYAIGDMHGEANVQFLASYEEHVGPAVFEGSRKVKLYNRGELLDPYNEFTSAGGSGLTFKQTTGVIIPQSMAFRPTPMTIQSDGTNTHEVPTGVSASLANHFS